MRKPCTDCPHNVKHHIKPHMALCSGVFCLSEERLWDYDDCGGIKMDKNKYRKVTFSNSPRKVEVGLKLIEK